MKLSDCIKYSFTKTIRDKKNIYFIIIMTLCLFVLIASLFFRIVYFKIVDEYKEMSKDSKTLTVLSNEIGKYMDDKTYDLGYDKILELEHVVDVYDNKYSFYYIISENFKDDTHDGSIKLVYGSEASEPKYINGTKIKNDDTGVAICSKTFYPNSTENGISNNDINFINADTLIGSTFEIKTQKYTKTENGFVPSGMYKKEYKIIGTFDASETRDDLDTCYISSKDMQELVDVTNTNDYDVMVSSYNVIIDKYDNIDKTAEEIKQMGFKVTRSEEDNSMLDTIKLICLLIITIITIAIIFLASLYVKKQNMKNKNEIAIMKSYGFENIDIMKFSLSGLSCLMLISFIAGIILFIITKAILTTAFSNFLLENHIYIGFYISPYVTALIILMIITIITNYFTINKLSKRQTLSVIKE